jgi:2-polyprenyl-6-hydroxyphenyl methylase/3-demethylubiquinone-9 3-methyltransferase
MIEAARRRLRRSPWRAKVSFEVDAAERLATVADESVDVAIFVGALEHVLDQGAAVANAFRVLKPGGRLVCLTLNGGSLWYRRLAPALGLEMRRLSTDRYLSRRELARLLHAAGFGELELGHWTFVQRGDLPPLFAALLQGLDGIGRLLRSGALRGGLRARAAKPRSPKERP